MAKSTKKAGAKTAEATRKKTVAKKAPAKKTVAKKKPTTRKRAAAKKATAVKSPTVKALTLEERNRMISEAAYLRSEAHDFLSDEREDWLLAEAEIDAHLVKAGISVTA